MIAEYEPSGASGLLWKTGYVYLGGRLLATTNANGTRFHHPDRLGTNVVTDQSNGELVTKQMGLPYGTQQPSGAFGGDNSWQHSSKTNPSRQRFTSYDRSAATGLDYAVNRHYSSAQGRFTQVDPIGMSAVSLGDPQSLNLYAYCGNDPVNNVDPDGLFFKKLFGWIGKALKWIAIAAAIAVAVISIAFPGAWIANLAIWASKHSILSAILGINTPKFAIINLVAISAKSGAIGLGAGAYLASTVGAITSLLAQKASEGAQTPITVRSMNQKYVKDFLKALQEAQKRLLKADCAKLFGKSSSDLVKMLENTEYRVLTLASGGPKIDPDSGKVSVVGAQTNSATSVFINDKGPFFNQYMFVPDKSGMQILDLNSGLRGAQFGALLLLHELGHQTGVFGSDAGNGKLNREYTRSVQKACF